MKTARQIIEGEPNYSAGVDPHIYVGQGAGAKTVSDWIDVAIAAIDQAGFSVKVQEHVRDDLELHAEREGLIDRSAEDDAEQSSLSDHGGAVSGRGDMGNMDNFNAGLGQ
jgi:hypothetical protein